MVKPNTNHQKGNNYRSFFINKKNKPSALLVAIVVVLFAAIGARLLFGALAATGSLSLVPSTSNVSLGNNITLVIHENSGTDAVNAVEADLTYDQTKFQFVSTDFTSTTPTNCVSAFDLSASNTGGSGSVKIARAKSSTSLTGDQIVGCVTFKAIGTGTTPVSFAATSALVRASDTVNVLVSTSPGSYVIADTTAPSVPTGLTAGARTVTTLAFTWTASTDNVAVTGYKVFRNGTQVGGTVAGTNFTDTGLTPNTNYSYTVAAVDAAGNTSAQSTALAIATLPDTTAPSVPTGLTAGTRTVTAIAFTWTASTDNVAVTGYRVFRNGTQISGNTTSTSFNDTGLTPNTSYSYTVAAFDAAGNVSAQSTALAIATLPDTTAPSVPTGLTSPSQTVNSISLTWTASTDNVAVTGYKVFRNGTQVGGTITTTSFTDTGLTQITQYSYTVAAIDAAGNTSVQSSALLVSTKAKPGDVNSDGSVDVFDLSILASHFGQSGQTLSTGDLNGDGTVNVFDLSILATNWGL